MKIVKEIIFLASIFFAINSYALSPEARLANEKDEVRAMQLFVQIKCLVCEAQSVESSNTEFSSAMRELIRQKISAGKNDEEIKQELTNEFGEQILMSASLKNIAVWILPLLFAFFLGLFLIFKKEK